MCTGLGPELVVEDGGACLDGLVQFCAVVQRSIGDVYLGVQVSDSLQHDGLSCVVVADVGVSQLADAGLHL